MTAERARGGRNSHALHAGERIWPESNCYVDLWIGLLHHLALDPVAMLACAVAPYFEGDQWTFCKPTSSELGLLYGIRVEELSIWRGLRAHIERQVGQGRVVLVEVDGYFLPDTRGVTYGVDHRKTTIGIHGIDVSTGLLSYFHNAGSYSVNGADVDGLLATTVSASALPPFAELADHSRCVAIDGAELRARSLRVAAGRVALASPENPFLAWAEAADAELDSLSAGDLSNFHAWAFATVRQAGSMTELLAAWCDWLGDEPELRVASIELRELAQTLAAQQFRLARLPGGGRRPAFADALRRCAAFWESAQRTIARAVDHELGERVEIPSAVDVVVGPRAPEMRLAAELAR
ncbi:MAG: DUF1839 family protein [Gemmatimonadaceae bacterium]